MYGIDFVTDVSRRPFWRNAATDIDDHVWDHKFAYLWQWIRARSGLVNVFAVYGCDRESAGRNGDLQGTGRI